MTEKRRMMEGEIRSFFFRFTTVKVVVLCCKLIYKLSVVQLTRSKPFWTTVKRRKILALTKYFQIICFKTLYMTRNPEYSIINMFKNEQ